MMVTANGVELYVEQRGAGSPALVFLHYWGGSSRTWRHVVDRLAPDFRTITVDQRGWGRSATPTTGYSLADLADDVEAVVAALDLERYVLVGHSMGGKVSQLVASRRSRGLAGIVLVAPAPPGPLDLPLSVREAMLHAYDTRESVIATVGEVLAPGGLDPHDLEAVITDSLAGAPAAKTAWPLFASQEDVTPALARIEVPVIVISGEHDRVDPPETLRRELLPRLAQAEMHLLPGAGHLLPYEAPDHVADLVGAFVLSLGDAAARSRCTWCGISLAAAADARLARTRMPAGTRPSSPDAPRDREEA